MKVHQWQRIELRHGHWALCRMEKILRRQPTTSTNTVCLLKSQEVFTFPFGRAFLIAIFIKLSHQMFYTNYIKEYSSISSPGVKHFSQQRNLMQDYELCLTHLVSNTSVMDFQLYHRFLVQKESKWLRFFWDVLLAEWPKKAYMQSKQFSTSFTCLNTTHNTATLQYMVEALDQFDANKNFFIKTSIRSDLKIPKFHSFYHFIESIKLFGTTNNYNTKMFECLHIDFANKGWRASNQRDVFPQMVTWLSQQEKISSFDNYLDFVEKKLNPIPSSVTLSNSKNLPISIVKFPTFPNKLIYSIEATHHPPCFSQHLKEYLNSLLNHPTSTRRSNSYALPFTHLNVFSQFKFHPVSLDDTD